MVSPTCTTRMHARAHAQPACVYGPVNETHSVSVESVCVAVAVTAPALLAAAAAVSGASSFARLATSFETTCLISEKPSWRIQYSPIILE